MEAGRGAYLCAELVDGLHVGGLHGDGADLLAGAADGALDADLDDLTADDLALLADLDADGAAEGLSERLGLAHLEGEDLAGGDLGEGSVLSEGLGDAHGDGRLAGTGLTGEQHDTAGNLTVLDHAGDDAGGLVTGD